MVKTNDDIEKKKHPSEDEKKETSKRKKDVRNHKNLSYSSSELNNIILRSCLHWEKEIKKMLKTTRFIKDKMKLLDLESELDIQIIRIKKSVKETHFELQQAHFRNYESTLSLIVEMSKE